MRVAVIGAGVAGLACARALAGHQVAVFDKGRGPGGRMSAKRWAVEGAELRVDLGAQYFTVRDPGFSAQVERLGRAVARWRPRLPDGVGEGWFVGTPAMSALPRALADGLDVRTGVQVAPPEQDGDAWALRDSEGTALGRFDAVVVATPAEQAAALLAGAPALAEAARAARTAPCWSAALWMDGAGADFDAARDPSPNLGWLARHASRPGRDRSPVWVAHASAAWTRANLERGAADVATEMGAMAAAVLGGRVRHALAHRWRYALVEATAGPAWDPELRAGACGDWCAGPRVELAWTAGDALGRAIAG